MGKILVALYVFATSTALVLLKLGSKSGAPVYYLAGKVHFNLNSSVIGGVMLYGISFMLYTFLISKYDIGYIIPLTTAFVYIFIFFASFAIFNESFTLFKIIGISLMVMGLVFLNLKK